MDRQLNAIWQYNIICCTGIAIFTVFELNNIASFLFYTSFVITAISFYLCLRKKVTHYTKNTLVTLLYIFLFGLISVMPGHFNFGYIKKFLIYLTTLLSYYISFKLNPTSKTITILLRSNLLVALAYIFRSQTPGAYLGNMLFLFFSNPNFTAMWLYMSLILVLTTVLFVNKRIYKIVLLAIACQLMYLCFQTESRNILLAIMFAGILGGICWFSTSIRFKNWFIFCVDIFPLLFAVVYMILLDQNLISERLTDLLVSEGKYIDSRYEIWASSFEYIGKRPLFGAYSLISGGSGSFQLHNSHIDIWAAFGTVGFVLFLIYVYRIMKEVNDSCKTKGAMFALIGFMCMTLMGNAEAGLYANGMGMYIYVSSFILLGNYLNHTQQNESSLSF